MATIDNNPWKGLAAYAEGDLIYGRDNDIRRLNHMIVNHPFVTLYGQTGIGKTSLLRAGVFPELRYDDILPVVVRFSEMSANEVKTKTMAQFLAEKVVAIEGIEVEVNEGVGNDPVDFTALDCLWKWFRSRKFYKNGTEVVPAVVLDQFEENFITEKSDTWRLMEQLYAMIGISYITPENYNNYNNFHIVFSIREDDLFRMEDCIDNRCLNQFKNNRYRLNRLSDDDANAVILNPAGAACMVDGSGNAADDIMRMEIADAIIAQVKGNCDDSISSLILSLVCFELYNRGNGRIELDDAKRYGSNGNFLRTFYRNLAADMPKQLRKTIETKLIDENNGRRKSVYVDDVADIKGWEAYKDGAKRILQQSAGKVELVHDMLGRAVFEEIQLRRKSRSRAILFGIFCAVLLAMLGITALGTVYNLPFAIPSQAKSDLSQKQVPDERYIEKYYGEELIVKNKSVSINLLPRLQRLVVAKTVDTLKVNDCKSLETIVFEGDSLSSIDIDGCQSLKYLRLPRAVNELDIPDNKIYGNSNLKYVFTDTCNLRLFENLLWNGNEFIKSGNSGLCDNPSKHLSRDMSNIVRVRYNDTGYDNAIMIDNIIFSSDTLMILGYHNPVLEVVDLSHLKSMYGLNMRGCSHIRKLIVDKTWISDAVNIDVDTLVFNVAPHGTYYFTNPKTIVIVNDSTATKEDGVIKTSNGGVILSSEFKGKYYENVSNDSYPDIYGHGFRISIVRDAEGYYCSNWEVENYDELFDAVQELPDYAKECVKYESESNTISFYMSDGEARIGRALPGECVTSMYIPILDCSLLDRTTHTIIADKYLNRFENLQDSVAAGITLLVPPELLDFFIAERNIYRYGFKEVREMSLFEYFYFVEADRAISGCKLYFSNNLWALILMIAIVLAVGIVFFILNYSNSDSTDSPRKMRRCLLASVSMMVIGIVSWTVCYWFVWYAIGLKSQLWCSIIGAVFAIAVLLLFYKNVLFEIHRIQWRKSMSSACADIESIFLSAYAFLKRQKWILIALSIILVLALCVKGDMDYVEKRNGEVLELLEKAQSTSDDKEAIIILDDLLYGDYVTNSSTRQRVESMYDSLASKLHINDCRIISTVNSRFSFNTAVCSPDGSTMLLGTNNKVYLWSLADGLCIDSINDVGDEPAFIDNGKSIIVTKGVNVYTVPVDNLRQFNEVGSQQLRGSYSFCSWSSMSVSNNQDFILGTSYQGLDMFRRTPENRWKRLKNNTDFFRKDLEGIVVGNNCFGVCHNDTLSIIGADADSVKVLKRIVLPNKKNTRSNIIKGCGNDTVVVKNYDEMYMLCVSSGEKITTIATDNWYRGFALNADGNLVITRERGGYCIYDLSYSNGTPKYTIGDMSIGFTFFRPGYEMYFVGNNSICFPENINDVNYLFIKDFTGREYSLEERIANTHFNLDAVRTYLNKK